MPALHVIGDRRNRYQAKTDPWEIVRTIIDERKKGDFKNWDDLVSRVKGIGDATAAKLSAEGLTVKGAEFKKAAAAKAEEKKEEKKEAKADKK